MRSNKLITGTIIQLLLIVILTAFLQFIAASALYSRQMVSQAKRSFVELVALMVSENDTKESIVLENILGGEKLEHSEGSINLCVHWINQDKEGVNGAVDHQCSFLDQNLLKRIIEKSKEEPVVAITTGSVWDNFSYRGTDLVVAMPLSRSDSERVLIIGKRSLLPLYQQLSVTNKHLIGFIVLNIIVVVVVGYFRFSKFLIKPLEKLSDKVSNYKDDNGILFEEEGSSAFNRLSHGLSSMLSRIEYDKKSLQNSVSDLERANRKLEESKNLLIRSETLASVGRFSAGMAHEIGNPLAIVQGYLDLLQNDDLSDEDRKQFIGRADRELERVKILLEKLLQFARSDTKNGSEQIEVVQLIEEVLSFLTIEKRFKNVEICRDYKVKEAVVRGSYDGLKQVIINCLLNAVDALSEVVDTNVPLINIFIESPNNKLEDEEHQFVNIKILDNGPGVDEDVLEKAFDPFVTTKEPGKGTGLGLYVSHSIIAGMGGALKIDNAEQGGCEVAIQLPVAFIETASEKSQE